MCGERQRQRQREKRDRKNGQGTGTLADATGAGHGRARQTFWGRKETENSAVGCALSRTVLEPSCYGAWWRGGRGGGGDYKTRGGFYGVMHLSYGTTTAD